MEKNFKVIKIVDEETLIINAGLEDGIQRGDEFEIFEKGEDLIDLDTGENLGSLDTIKETVEAINVFPKFCVCRHNVTVSYITGLVPNLYKNEYKTLNIDSSQISGGFDDDITIRINDRARKVNSLHQKSNK